MTHWRLVFEPRLRYIWRREGRFLVYRGLRWLRNRCPWCKFCRIPSARMKKCKRCCRRRMSGSSAALLDKRSFTCSPFQRLRRSWTGVSSAGRSRAQLAMRLRLLATIRERQRLPSFHRMPYNQAAWWGALLERLWCSPWVLNTLQAAFSQNQGKSSLLSIKFTPARGACALNHDR